MSLATNALISVEEYLIFKGEPVDGEVNEDQIEAHINSASDMIQNFCCRVICPTTDIVEKFNGNGFSDYYVKHRVINGTPTLYNYDGVNWNEMTTTDYPRDISASVGLIELLELSRFTKGKKNYKVEYNTGYAIGNVPSAIKHACFILTQRFILSANDKEGLQSESFGEGTSSYDLSSIPDKVKKLLRPYRNIQVV